MSPRRETPFVTATTLFAGEFRRGRSYENWRPRGSGDWLLIFTAEGAGLLTSATRQAVTKPGEIIVHAPGELQDYRTDPTTGHWHLLWTHFIPRPAWLPWLKWPAGVHGVRSIQIKEGEARDRFVAAMRRIVHFQRREFPHATEFAFNALEEALLWSRLAAGEGRWQQLDERIRRAMDYLTADLRRPFRMDALARHCALSPSRLAHLFTKEVGHSPQQFCEQQRMRHADQLLQRTSLAVAEIAAEAGYEDPFYFSNRFRRYAGCSPTDFRRKKRSSRPR